MGVTQTVSLVYCHLAPPDFFSVNPWQADPGDVPLHPANNQALTMNIENKKPFRITLDNEALEYLSERSRSLTKAQAIIDLVARRVDSPTEVTKNEQTFILQPGEAETSVNALAEEWHWDRKTVRRFLAVLNRSGCLSTRKLTYASVSTFPGVVTSPVETPLSSSADIAPERTPGKDGRDTSVSPVPEDSAGIPVTAGHVRYDLPPLELDEETREHIRHAYELFHRHLPLLEIPPYGPRVEKALYITYVLGMGCDEELLTRLLEKVAADPMRNGEMSELTGDDSTRESFVSLFSPRWQEMLFPASAGE